MFASRLASFNSVIAAAWRGSWPKLRTTRTPLSVSCR